MALQNLLGDVGLEATQQELLAQMTLYLAAIVEKLPRLDTSDRVLISHAESNPTIQIAASQTLTAVTGVGTLNGLGILARAPDAIPTHMSNAGAMHIYNNILVA